MAKTEGHSKLPWEVLGSVKDTGLKDGAIWIMSEDFETEKDDVCELYTMENGEVLRNENAEANAEFIVKAVNSHGKLVEACKLGLDMYELHTSNHPDDDLANSHKDIIRKAIKEAEGG